MNSHPVDLDIHQVDTSSLQAEALDIINGVQNWQSNKTFNHSISFKTQKGKSSVITTNTFNKTLNNDYWVARSTILSESLTESLQSKFQDYLIGPIPISTENNHTTHEKNYIHELYDFELKPVDDNSYIIKTFYKLPFPLSKRIFYNYVHIVSNQDYSLVISLSIEPKTFSAQEKNPGFTIGNYTSIEHLVVNDKRLHWTMCTASTPNGNIPSWITRMSLPGAIVNDVPGFLNYCDRN